MHRSHISIFWVWETEVCFASLVALKMSCKHFENSTCLSLARHNQSCPKLTPLVEPILLCQAAPSIFQTSHRLCILNWNMRKGFSFISLYNHPSLATWILHYAWSALCNHGNSSVSGIELLCEMKWNKHFIL